MGDTGTVERGSSGGGQGGRGPVREGFETGREKKGNVFVQVKSPKFFGLCL